MRLPLERWKLDIVNLHFDDLKAGMKSDKYIQCPECKVYLIWESIPDENILKDTNHEEFWGAPCSYESVVGYLCPACVTKIEF